MIVFRRRTISVIGAGCLGEQVVSALQNNGHAHVIATRRSEEQLGELGARYPDVRVSTDNVYATCESDVIILAVKPSVVDEVCKEVGPYAGGKLVISLAAAKSIAVLERRIANPAVRIARVMTGLYVSEQLAFYTLGGGCRSEDREAVRYIFGKDALGRDERLLAHRTYVACALGLLPTTIHEEIEELELLGLDPKDASHVFARDLEAIANRLRAGVKGREILQAVGGPGSFTQKLADRFAEQGHYRFLRESVARTVKACGGETSKD